MFELICPRREISGKYIVELFEKFYATITLAVVGRSGGNRRNLDRCIGMGICVQSCKRICIFKSSKQKSI